MTSELVRERFSTMTADEKRLSEKDLYLVYGASFGCESPLLTEK
jgi:hypothetical protein